MAQIEILPANGLWRILVYSKLPRLLYTGLPGFAPPLDLERLTLHMHALNPHFKLVEAQEFLARRDGKWVGRILAQVYKPEFTPVGASRFQFGSLDAIDDLDVVRALTEAAENWLRARGATVIHGPYSPSVNHESGLLVSGFEEIPVYPIPWHPPYLGRLLESLGYVRAHDLLNYQIDIAQQESERDRTITTRREWAKRLKLREIDFSKFDSGETAMMMDLYNDGWRDNWGFVPFTQEVLKSIVDGLRYATPQRYTIVAELDGDPKSFVVALPNLNEITQDLGGKLFPFGIVKLIARLRKHQYATVRIILFGTRKALQNSATGGAVFLAMIEEMRRRGKDEKVSRLEAGWVLDSNIAMRKPIEMFGGKVDKIHRVYEKRV